MNPYVLLSIIIAYFAILLWVAYRTGKGSNNESFFIGNRKSNWMLVAFGMIGTSLSGVTFVSVPGAVGADKFHYLQITIGYLIGYIIIAYVLLPLYYRLKLTSIYGYLQERMGQISYKSGAWIFIVSRLVGATARLYLVVNILQFSGQFGCAVYCDYAGDPRNDYSVHLRRWRENHRLDRYFADDVHAFGADYLLCLHAESPRFKLYRKYFANE